eukprot:Em0018g789a
MTVAQFDEKTTESEGVGTIEAVPNVSDGLTNDIEVEHTSLSHVEVMKQIKQQISDLLADPFLQDLPKDVSLDEAKSQLALEEGKAIILSLRRYDGERVPVIIMQGATVQDLMRAIEKEITRKCNRSGKTQYISWRYVWRTYWLAHGQQKLTDRSGKLVSYGVGNHDEITFVKKLRESMGKAPKRQQYFEQ